MLQLEARHDEELVMVVLVPVVILLFALDKIRREEEKRVVLMSSLTLFACAAGDEDEDEDLAPESPPSQLKLANELYHEEYPTPHSTQSQHDPGDANEAESQNGRPDNPQTSVSID